MNFGPQTTEEDSHGIMDHALELGLNFFDTADVYGWKRGEGWTEAIIGRWIAQGNGRRDKVVLATKVYGDMGDWPNTSRLSALHIRRACEGSLKRLQTDYIDLYQMHHIWREAPWEEVWEAFSVLRQQGKVLYFGSSNFAAWQIAMANHAAANFRMLGLVCEQCQYSLLHRLPEIELIPCTQELGLAIIPWSPLAGGALAGALEKAAGGRRAGDNVQQKVEANREKVEAWESLCRDLGEQPADVAMAWLLGRPGVTAPIIGPRTKEQLEGSLRALDIMLEQETLDRIDAIFPAYRMAPEAYSW